MCALCGRQQNVAGINVQYLIALRYIYEFMILVALYMSSTVN